MLKNIKEWQQQLIRKVCIGTVRLYRIVHRKRIIMTKIVAVAGKGGVGKTSLAGAFVKVLVEKYPDKKILAIDADPAVGLSTVLNIEVDKTIDDIRKKSLKCRGRRYQVSR